MATVGAAPTTVPETAEKLSTMDKLKHMGLDLKGKAQKYIEANPHKVEEMKKHALDGLQKQIDAEVEKEEAAKLACGTECKPQTTYEKLKDKTVGKLIKPQVDKLAGRQTSIVEAYKKEDAAKKPGEGGATEESVEIASSLTKGESPSSTTKTENKGEEQKIQDLVTNLLNILDESKLSDEEKKKVVNGFNAAYALKQI